MQIESSRVGMAKQGMITLKMVAPVIPRGAEEKAMLEEDLKRMRCHGLMLRPWSIKYEKIMQELCCSTKTQVNLGSALKRPKHHQSDQSIVLGILGSSFLGELLFKLHNLSKLPIYNTN